MKNKKERKEEINGFWLLDLSNYLLIKKKKYVEKIKLKAGTKN